MNKMINVAKAVSELSKDKTKIGAVAVSTDGVIIGAGYNGYPSGYDDEDLTYKHEKVIHAEVNALINSRATRGQVEKLYIYGLPPCKDCMKFIAAYKVKEVHFMSNKEIVSYSTWRDSYLEHFHLHDSLEFIEYDRHETSLQQSS